MGSTAENEMHVGGLTANRQGVAVDRVDREGASASTLPNIAILLTGKREGGGAL